MRVLHSSSESSRQSLALGFAVVSVLFASCTTLDDGPPVSEVPDLDVEHSTLPVGEAHDVAWADFDRDGDGDLIFVSGEPPVLRLFLNDGQNSFAEASASPFASVEIGASPKLTTGDVDRDRDPDVVVCFADADAGRCLLLLNRQSEREALSFDDGTMAFASSATPFVALPILTDHDGDGDSDLIVLPRDRSAAFGFMRNDHGGSTPASFSELQGISTEVNVGPVRQAIEVETGIDPDLSRARHLLYVSNTDKPDQLLQLDDATFAYSDVTAERLQAASPITGATVAVADVNNDRRPDLLAHELTHFSVLVQDEAGVFRDRTDDVAGLPELNRTTSVLLAEDFDRDGNVDLFVAGDETNDHLLLLRVPNEVSSDTSSTIRFIDATRAAAVNERQSVAGAKVFLRPEACDAAVDLVVAGAGTGGTTRLHLFADDSERKTISAADSLLGAPEEDGCVRGSSGDDELVGHRVSSLLVGGGGNDTLRARAGFTVMSGGPGVDLFEARGITLVLMPEADIAEGDTIDCSNADFVYVDSPRTLVELESAGVRFIECLPDESCLQDLVDTRRLRRNLKHHVEPPSDEIADCHEQPTRLDVFSAGLEPNAQAVGFGRDLDFVSNSGSGFGSCSTSADCYAIGLDACRTSNGGIPFGGQRGKCYPSGFNGFEGPIADWCHDPFWARLRFDEIQSLFNSDDRKLVIPVTFWLIRSEAATDGGGCSMIPNPSPMSIDGWHDSLIKAMNTGFAYFDRWGITFDYQFRVFEVPVDSAWIADTEDDPCRTQLEPGGSKANSVGKLIDEFELDVYNPGEFNVYMKDLGGSSWSSSAMVDNGNEKVKFLILSAGAGAFVHEMGHGVGLPHPYSKNTSASGTNPDVSESRDSWLTRAFPDDEINRLELCDDDDDCDGIDVSPGVCRKAPNASKGFCQNLKKDCAEDGDHVCDTPWDSFPCFRHVSNNEGAACTTQDDCQGDSSVRGRAFLTRCTGTGHCTKVGCSENSDCDSGSWCADGTCVIWKSGTDSCCHISTDRGAGFDHNVCYELRPNGSVVNVPGVGASTSWPIDDNAMAYHRPFGRKRTFTDGQRDQAVCDTSYRTDFGPMLRKPLDHDLGGQPCSLRPGATAFDYGDVGETRLIPHGACLSGVCALTDAPAGTIAFCTDSTCSDGVRGAGETSIDCGGVCPNPCPTSDKDGKGSSQCADDNDCVSGSCRMGTCQATCEDGIKNGSEVEVDSGGRSFDSTCGGQFSGELCRYAADCGPSAGCQGEATCVLSADCPINDDVAACTEDTDCTGNGTCVVMRALCASSGCFTDSECPSGICQLPEQRCVCDDSNDCFSPTDACVPSQSMCINQCVDGRCLGECGIGISIGG